MSLSENSQGSCGEGFWEWPKRRDRSIPVANCDGRTNAVHRQKTGRPEGFRTGSKKKGDPQVALMPFQWGDELGR